MKLFVAVLVLALMYNCEAAKRVKMCDTNNAESPGKTIYMTECYDGQNYKCLDGKASNKGKWETCQAVSTPFPDDVNDFMENWCEMFSSSRQIVIYASGGDDSDALCVEAIDYEDILTTFCDDVAGEDHIMSKGAGFCESFGWGALREYQRLWFDEGSGRCNGFTGNNGGNGQEFLVTKTMCASDSLG